MWQCYCRVRLTQARASGLGGHQQSTTGGWPAATWQPKGRGGPPAVVQQLEGGSLSSQLPSTPAVHTTISGADFRGGTSALHAPLAARALAVRGGVSPPVLSLHVAYEPRDEILLFLGADTHVLVCV